ncbi:MAG: DUF87 domain-containing protein [Bacillota bacterium]|jgi:hypothetical protein|nr:DUF87 domain-containing protein [Bacillota bacterium]
MQDFEKLGVFYLGKEYDLEQKQLQEKLVLYKSKDLTTHAVIIGMTGSGKTGLGIGIIEEAALDNIPVIAIDPKGDLGNLALTFPELRGEDFRPWINLHEASNKGVPADEYAKSQAELWRKGLADWGQDGKRIEKFRNAADITVYTPGGSAGPGVSVLRSFDAPPPEIRNDRDAYRDRIQITTTGLLSLIGLDGDPFTSREHVLVSNIIEHAWNSGQSLSLSELINAIQAPPMDRVGVMDMESFYPSKDRFSLAMMLNNLLASPSFKAWLEGDPLDVNRFLYNDEGKPRVSVFSIAHLSDSERMFFVTMLLNEVLSWVRSQPGTGSLRALLYMDELFGYLPPTANPPSKVPLLTLLKQARAYGLGLVLSTQNPVDLDYKALSNAGTWFIGRLQTERDKERVLAGLEGALAGGKFDRQHTGRILAGLGQRIFYLHSVHEDEPVIFSTRWVLSYLAGPLTREQISALSSKRLMSKTAEDAPAFVTREPVAKEAKPTDALNLAAPVLDPKIQQVYLPVDYGVTDNVTYVPSVIGVADVLYDNAKHQVAASKSYTLVAPLHDGPVALDWREAKSIELDLRDLDAEPVRGASFANYPNAAANARSYDSWKKLFAQFIRTDLQLKLFSSPTLKVVSEVDEDERDFRIRLQHLAHEKRDEALDALRKKYASKINTLEDRQRRAKQALEKQSTRAAQKKMDAAVSTGAAILGTLFGRKSMSATSISRVGTAVKSTTRAFQSGEGIAQAEETLRSVEAQLEQLESELQQQVEKISESYDMLEEKLEEVQIRATSGNIAVHLVGLAWCPSPKGQGLA